MKTLTLTLLATIAIPLFGQLNDPAKTLYDAGIRQEQAGKLDTAKLILMTLASTYTDEALVAKAKVEIGAICLFKEAQAQVAGGQALAGYAEYRTITRIYPESPLAKLADETAKALNLPVDPRRY